MAQKDRKKIHTCKNGVAVIAYATVRAHETPHGLTAPMFRVSIDWPAHEVQETGQARVTYTYKPYYSLIQSTTADRCLN